MRGEIMSDFRFLKNQELIHKLHGLAKLEKKTTAEIVAVIAEVDRRKLFLDLGHTSLFSYLTVELGYTAASAQRRIDAARLLASVPEMKGELESGALNLIQISVVSQIIRQKKKESPKVSVGVSEKRELLEQVKGLDLAQTQRLVAQALDLEVQVHERKRVQQDDSLRLELTLTKQQQEKLHLARELLSHIHPSLSWAELFAVLADELIKRRDPRREPKRKSRRGSLRHELTGKNESAKLASTSRMEVTTSCEPENAALTTDDATNLQNGFKTEPAPDQTSAPKDRRLAPATHKAAMAEKDRTRLGVRTIERAAWFVKGKPICKLSTINRRKAIPLSIKREAFQRDQSCRWIDPITKRKCESRFQLELDHIKSVWAGGQNHPDNLQLLCRVHNAWKFQNEIS